MEMNELENIRRQAELAAHDVLMGVFGMTAQGWTLKEQEKVANALIAANELLQQPQWQPIESAGDYVRKYCWVATYHPDDGVYVTDDFIFAAERYMLQGCEVRYFMPYYKPQPPKDTK